MREKERELPCRKVDARTMSDDKLEIEYTHEEMEELEEEVKNGLKQLDKLDGAKRQEKANHLDDRLKRLKVIAFSAPSSCAWQP